MAIYHDVRELMQEDNRPTFVGVVRFKMEINVTREWYRLGNDLEDARKQCANPTAETANSTPH